MTESSITEGKWSIFELHDELHDELFELHGAV
jgi:hypothetical protein